MTDSDMRTGVSYPATAGEIHDQITQIRSEVAERASETWKPIPGYFAEASTHGNFRSVDRTLANGTKRKATSLATTVSNRGYVLVKVYDHDGVRQTRTGHSLVLLAHEGECPPGMEVRHWNDVSDDNRWAPGGEASCGPGKPGNLLYGSKKQNRADGLRNTPPAPKPPPRLCEPHGRPVARGSKSRCHDCVAEVGIQGARLLRDGLSKEAAAAEIGYPSPDGLVTLAVKYGGHAPSPEPVTAAASPRWSQRVMTTVRGWLRRGDA